MKEYKLYYSSSFIKDLKKMDKYIQLQIKSWIVNNLENTINPRNLGKALLKNHKNKWRYRIGEYRILALINDSEITLLLLRVGHRKEIYKK